MKDAMLEGISKKVGPDKWKFKGQVGRWRTVGGNEVFFPDGGGQPLGVPKKLNWFQRALKKLRGEGVEVTMAHAFALCEESMGESELAGAMHFLGSMASAGLHLSENPNKTWGFVGSVPAELRFERRDGGPMDDEALEVLIKELRIGKTGKKTSMFKARVWPTRNAAIQAAKKAGYQIVGEADEAGPVAEWGRGGGGGGRGQFQDHGGKSALRRATKGNSRIYPCPTCKQPNKLTAQDKARGYQCDDCANREEGAW